MKGLQMERSDVEKLLDLKVNAGRMTPEMKEEYLREYDRKVAEMVAEKTGQPVPDQYMGQTSGQLNGQDLLKTQLEQQYPGMHYNGTSMTYLSNVETIAMVILAIVLVVFAMRDNTFMTVFLMGVMFTYVSVAVISKDLKNKKGVQLVAAVAGICGLGMLAYAFFLMFGSKAMKDSFDANNGIIACISSIVIGLFLIVGNLIGKSKSKGKYTYPVQAKCVELLSPRHGSHVPAKLTPVYEFYLNGEMKRISNSTYSNKGNPKAGEVREIFIDPDKLDGYYDPQRSGSISISMIILGSFFIAMGILLLVLGH